MSKIQRVLDVAVVGFGPAGISLACAIEDWIEAHQLPPTGPVLFLEKSPGTEWHGDFLLANTDINHHIFRDLVTPRNPRSRFSFAMYLHAHDRLYSFGLLGRPPSRTEWSDYLAWAAGQLAHHVSYGDPVLGIEPVLEEGELAGFLVRTEKAHYQARRLVLSCGSYPHLPSIFFQCLGTHVFHTSNYLSRLRWFAGGLPKRWMVLGSGQSAGEAVSDLLARGDDLVIHSVHRSIGFRIGQLGQFPNKAFLPEQVDYFHALPADKRRELFAQARATNYAGVDVDESRALYSFIYESRLRGQERLLMHAFRSVESVRQTKNSLLVRMRDIFTGDVSEIDVDAIVLGTGYEQPPVPPLLAELLPWLDLDEDGGVKIDRDYRIAIKARPGTEIFANGLSERAHGISDAQSFSLVAVRAQRILSSLAAPEQATPARTSVTVARHLQHSDNEER